MEHFLREIEFLDKELLKIKLMKVALRQSYSIEFKQTTKNNEIKDLSEKLETFFKLKDYGASIQSYIIGVIYAHPNFDPFYKIRKPKYFEDEKEIHDGLEAYLYKSFEFNVKLDFYTFFNSTKEEGLKMIANEIMQALSDINYPKKVTDFNGAAFHKDVECFFRDLNLLQ